MDQVKIGKFISERRKAVKLTQMQLAEKLGITDRAVSKWECGRSLPDSSLMIELCEILEINVNDLLCGEIVKMENYNKEAEKNLIEVVKQKERSDKQLLVVEVVLGVVSTLVLLIPTLVAAYVEMADWLRGVLIISGFVSGILGFVFCMKIEQTAGYYQCRICKHKYVPELKTMYGSMHMGRIRYMKCPKCNKKSWQRKVLSLEDD